jgi:holo-[acyl-carrier protein] synthase
LAVVGVGVDAIEIDRVRTALARTPALLGRVYTERERAQCEARVGRRRHASFAARFAAKEAVAKALGTGLVGFGFRDVEIVNHDSGAPQVVLLGGAWHVAARIGIRALHVSLSVSRDMAVAAAVAES